MIEIPERAVKEAFEDSSVPQRIRLYNAARIIVAIELCRLAELDDFDWYVNHVLMTRANQLDP